MLNTRLMILPVVVAPLVIAGCREGETVYDTSTPEAMATSLRQMVANDEPSRVVELIDTPSPELKPVIAELGTLIAAADGLRLAIEEQMPDEIEALRERTADAGFDEYISALFSGASAAGLGGFGGMMGGGAPMPSGGDAMSRDRIRDLGVMTLIEPFRAIKDRPDDLGVVAISDDLAALTWGGRPILPPFGLTARKTDDGWRIALPLEGPALRQIAPANEDEGEVLAGLITVVANTMSDLERDVRAGQVVQLEGLTGRATEKLMMPAGMTLMAYMRLKGVSMDGMEPPMDDAGGDNPAADMP